MFRVGRDRDGTKVHVVTMDTRELDEPAEDGSLWKDYPIAWCSRKTARITMTSGDKSVYDLVTCERCRIMLADARTGTP